MFFLIWALFSIASFVALTSLYHHAVSAKEGVRRTLRSAFKGGYDQTTAWFGILGSILAPIMLPGLIICARLCDENLAGTKRGWLLIILANVPWWIFLAWVS